MRRELATPRVVRRFAAAVALTAPVAVLCPACGYTGTGSSDMGAAAPAAGPSHELTVAGRRITLLKADWREMENEATFARNFEATSNPPNRKSQIVTIYVIPMSAERRVGQQLSPAEYLEVFSVLPGQVVVQVRRDHGAYWVLSRETFEGVAVPGVEFTGVRNLSDAEIGRVREALGVQVDTTRHLLGERLRAS